MIAVVGESGSGKTTLAKTLLRLETPTSGRAIVYDQVVAGQRAPRRPSRNSSGWCSPSSRTRSRPSAATGRSTAYLHETARRVAGMDQSQAEAAVADALHSVGLDYGEVRGKYTNQFSGGELQRISVARALIPQPKLIVADEPVSMIDASRRMIIINLFKRLRDEAGRSFLYITHDLATAYYIIRLHCGDEQGAGGGVRHGARGDVQSAARLYPAAARFHSDHHQPLAHPRPGQLTISSRRVRRRPFQSTETNMTKSATANGAASLWGTYRTDPCGPV